MARNEFRTRTCPVCGEEFTNTCRVLPGHPKYQKSCNKKECRFIVRKRRVVNPRIDGQIVYIPLTQDKETIVDIVDYESVLKLKLLWIASYNPITRNFYATRQEGYGDTRENILMHRLILGISDPEQVGDHKNGDTLDNRRNNLRIASRHQNAWNHKKHQSINRTKFSSKYSGVKFIKDGTWLARIHCFGKTTMLGYFSTEVEAAIAYNEAAILNFGEFARLNVINE